MWAVKLLLSQASVTSTKSSSSRRCRKLLRMLEWKSFQRREYCCSPLDEDDEAAMAPVPPGPTAEGTSGAIVLLSLVFATSLAPLALFSFLRVLSLFLLQLPSVSMLLLVLLTGYSYEASSSPAAGSFWLLLLLLLCRCCCCCCSSALHTLVPFLSRAATLAAPESSKDDPR